MVKRPQIEQDMMKNQNQKEEKRSVCCDASVREWVGKRPICENCGKQCEYHSFPGKEKEEKKLSLCHSCNCMKNCTLYMNASWLCGRCATDAQNDASDEIVVSSEPSLHKQEWKDNLYKLVHFNPSMPPKEKDALYGLLAETVIPGIIRDEVILSLSSYRDAILENSVQMLKASGTAGFIEAVSVEDIEAVGREFGV